MNHLPIRYSSIAGLFCLLLLGCGGGNGGEDTPRLQEKTKEDSQKDGGENKNQDNNL